MTRGAFETLQRRSPGCNWVVLVLTEDALASTWVEQEIDAAIHLKHNRRIQEILPIQAGPVDHDAIPPLWGVYNIFDATRNYTDARDGLLHALGLTAQPVASHVLPQRLAQLGYEAHANGSLEYILPPVVTVPAGEFLMGSDPKRDSGAYEWEQPQHRVSLPAFQIARFPLTVAEYACFVRDGHVAPTRWEYHTNSS